MEQAASTFYSSFFRVQDMHREESERHTLVVNKVSLLGSQGIDAKV